MLINDLIPKFASYLRNEKGSTPKTVTRYLYSIKKIIRDMKLIELTDFNEENINQNLIFKFWENLENGIQLAVSTKSNYIAALKSFNVFLVQKNYIKDNFTDKIAFPKPSQVFKDGFSDEEQKILREYLFKHLDTEQGKRDAALFNFLLGTGVRIDEALHLRCRNNIIFDSVTGQTYGDFELYDKIFYAHIHGKGKRERKVAVDVIAIGYIVAHLKNRKIVSDIIFNNVINNRSERIRLTVMGANKILKRVLNKAGIHRNLSTHTFRHTWAVNMINNVTGSDPDMNTKKILAQGGWNNEASFEAYYRRDRRLVKDFAGKNSIFKLIEVPNRQTELEKLMISSI